MNYKKDITNILPINNELTLKIFKNQIYIENFSKIIDITDNLITIDNYIIKGLFLKIISMENRRMVIDGKITEILVL